MCSLLFGNVLHKEHRRGNLFLTYHRLACECGSPTFGPKTTDLHKAKLFVHLFVKFSHRTQFPVFDVPQLFVEDRRNSILTKHRGKKTCTIFFPFGQYKSVISGTSHYLSASEFFTWKASGRASPLSQFSNCVVDNALIPKLRLVEWIHFVFGHRGNVFVCNAVLW